MVTNFKNIFVLILRK